MTDDSLAKLRALAEAATDTIPAFAPSLRFRFVPQPYDSRRFVRGTIAAIREEIGK